MKELKQKGNIERLEFNAIIGKDRVCFGGLQITPFQQAKTVVRLDAADNAEGGGVKINPSDFYEADFRMLTKSIVSPDNWKCVDFSTGNILKDALPLFNNNPVYTDHSTYSVKNAFGIVKSVWWDAASVTAEGVSVPAGINGKFSIDTTTPMGMQLARQIAIGAIFSVSVGIEFRWDASHVFENKWDWYDNIGVIQADGKMCRRICTKIENVLEVSLVHMGADPYAKIIGEDGKIVNPDHGAINVLKVLGLTKETDEKTFEKTVNNYEIICGYDEKVFALTKSLQDLSKERKNNSFMEFEKLLEKLGFTKEQFPTIESLLAHVEKLSKVSAKVAEIGLNVDELTKETVLSGVALDELKATLSNESAKVTSLTAERDALKSKANERLDKIRLDAEAKYRAAQLAASKEVDETIVSLLKESDEDKVVSLAKNFNLELIGEMKGTCVKCGSDNITFKSAKTEGTGGGVAAEKEADYLTTLAEKHSGFLN